MSAPAETTTAVPVVPAIYAAMAAVMREVEAVAKDRRNTQQGFDYRGIDDVYNELHSAFARHGIFMTSRVVDRLREERQTKSGGTLIYTQLLLEYVFHCAADGSSLTTQVMGEGMDSGDKGSNKAMAAAHKYALLQALLIPTAEPKDPDADSPPPSRSVANPKAPPITPSTSAQTVEQEAQNRFQAPAMKSMADLQAAFAALPADAKKRLKPILDRQYKPLAISAANKRLLEAMISELGLDREKVKVQVQQMVGATHFIDIPPAEFERVLTALKKS